MFGLSSFLGNNEEDPEKTANIMKPRREPPVTRTLSGPSALPIKPRTLLPYSEAGDMSAPRPILETGDNAPPVQPLNIPLAKRPNMASTNLDHLMNNPLVRNANMAEPEDERNYVEIADDAARFTSTPLGPRPGITAEERILQPYGIDPSKVGTTTPDSLDPLSRARLQVGYQPQKRGWARVLGDIAQGFLRGGSSEAINQGINGSKIRYEQDLKNATEQNALQDNFKRQQAEDALRAENVRNDNERLNKQLTYAHDEAMGRINARPTAKWQPYTGVDPATGNPVDMLYDENTGKFNATGFGHYEKPVQPKALSRDAAIAKYLAAHPEKMGGGDLNAQKQASSISSELQRFGDQKYIESRGVEGNDGEFYKNNPDARNNYVMQRLHSLGINTSYDPKTDVEAQAEIAAYMRGEEYTPQQRTLSSPNNQNSAPVRPTGNPTTEAPRTLSGPQPSNFFDRSTRAVAKDNTATQAQPSQPKFSPEQLPDKVKREIMLKYQQYKVKQPDLREKVKRDYGFDPETGM